MLKMIRKCAIDTVLLPVCCLAGSDQAMADDHGKFDEIVIELKFPSRNSEGTGNNNSGSPETPEMKGDDKGNTNSNASSPREDEAGNGRSSGIGGFKLEIIVPDFKSDETGKGGGSGKDGTGADLSDKTEKEGDAENENASSPKGGKSGKVGTASPPQKKTQKDKNKGSQGIDLGNPQGESKKKLDEIQKEMEDELDRVNKMLDESLETVTDIIDSLGKESQPSSSPPCTSTSGNVGVTHEFLDGIKECKCDGRNMPLEIKFWTLVSPKFVEYLLFPRQILSQPQLC